MNMRVRLRIELEQQRGGEEGSADDKGYKRLDAGSLVGENIDELLDERLHAAGAGEFVGQNANYFRKLFSLNLNMESIHVERVPSPVGNGAANYVPHRDGRPPTPHHRIEQSIEQSLHHHGSRAKMSRQYALKLCDLSVVRGLGRAFLCLSVSTTPY